MGKQRKSLCAHAFLSILQSETRGVPPSRTRTWFPFQQMCKSPVSHTVGTPPISKLEDSSDCYNTKKLEMLFYTGFILYYNEMYTHVYENIYVDKHRWKLTCFGRGWALQWESLWMRLPVMRFLYWVKTSRVTPSWANFPQNLSHCPPERREILENSDMWGNSQTGLTGRLY